MKTAPYLVIPEAGNPHGYFLINQEKGLKLYVKKVFEDQNRTSFKYHFSYLDSNGHKVCRADYRAFAYRKNITEMDHISAATWFLTKYFSYRELHYCFPEGNGAAVSGNYPVLGRYLHQNMFELSWD